MSLITKNKFMSVTDLYHTVSYIWHVVAWRFSSKLPMDFHEYCRPNMSGQLVIGIVFYCFWLKDYKNKIFCYNMTDKQYFFVEEYLKKQIIAWIHNNGVWMTVWYHQSLWKLRYKLCFQAFFGFVYSNLGVSGQTSIQYGWDRSLRLKIKEHEAKSTNSFTF